MPGERTLADFPIGTEVVAYIVNYGKRELRRGTVTDHTEHGSVVITPETMNRGRSWGASQVGQYDQALPRLRPGSPGLLRPEELAALQGSPAHVDSWVERGDTYKDAERRRLADKIRAYSGVEGPPAKQNRPPVRKNVRGVRKFSGRGNQC